MKRRIFAVALLAASAVASAGRAQNWEQIGPDPMNGFAHSLPDATVSGIINDIAIDPSGSTDSTIYIATGAGGIWKTTNGGSDWSSKPDSMSEGYMGAVSLDPSNPSIVYAGVGGFWCCFSGGGIYRSTDGADNWKLLNPNGIFTGVNINRIVLPTTGTLLIATNQGLYKSVDSGKNFGNNNPKFDNGNAIPIAGLSNGNISDLKVDTATPTTVYAAVFNNGLFRSTDSGTTFPAKGILIGSGSFPSSIGGNVWITFAQSTQPDNKTIYAFLCNGNKNANSCAVLKSKDRGTLFKSISPLGSDVSNNAGNYDQIVGVDPQDANKVYFGLRDLFFSADGGLSGIGSEINYDVSHTNAFSHVDNHAIAFSPPTHFTGPPTRVYIGSDGGFSSTAAEGSAPGSQWQNLNKGLATTLLYDMDFGRGSKANNAYIYGGFQDNGGGVLTPGQPWTNACCGDSSSVAVDPTNPLHALAQNGGLTCTNNGPQWSGAVCNFPANTPTISFVRFDPNGGIAYAAAATQLFQSTTNGSSFSLMHTFPNNITAMDQVKGDKNLIWVGLSNGTVSRTSTALTGQPPNGPH